MRGTEYLEHPFKPFLADNVPDTHQLGIIRGNAYSQVTLVDLSDQIGLVLDLDRTGPDLFHATTAEVGEDDHVAYLESHVAHPPSAVAMLPRQTGGNAHR